MAHTELIPQPEPRRNRVSDEDISDAYIYLLGRLLVLRQEQLEVRTGGYNHAGFRWNHLVHRALGAFATANPNLDVVYSEGWVAVDDATYTLIDVPPMGDRYFTIQVLNMWGETLANIGKRAFPGRPWGSFALCARGAKLSLPAGTVRIDLPSRKARVIARVELGSDPAEAVVLQHRITMRSSGSPRVAPTLSVPMFSNQALPGAACFDTALAVLGSEPDINPGAATMQARVRAVATLAAASRTERDRIDEVIRRQARPRLEWAVSAIGQSRNGWIRPRTIGTYGADWEMRTVVNMVGIWANTPAEVVYFGRSKWAPLDGSATHTMTFAADDPPSSHVQDFWSLTCVDANGAHVTPNALDRFRIESRTNLQRDADGSLTLYFAPRRPLGVPDENWLPTPELRGYFLTWRSYGPDDATVHGRWFPPPIERISRT